MELFDSLKVLTLNADHNNMRTRSLEGFDGFGLHVAFAAAGVGHALIDSMLIVSSSEHHDSSTFNFRGPLSLWLCSSPPVSGTTTHPPAHPLPTPTTTIRAP